MPEQSARLGIPLPLENENVSRQAIREMFQAVDDHAETAAGAQAKADAAAGGVTAALVAHKADFTQQIPYAVTGGSANAYTAATIPALSALVAGVAITVKINAANTGAATLNWNGKGAKSIKNPDGTNVESGDLPTGGVFTLRYDGTNFILQGKGEVKLTGDAVAANVTAGKTFYNTDPKTKVVGTAPTKAAQTYTPGTTNQTIASGQILTGVQTIAGSANLVPANIKEGVNIFGRVGTLTPASGANIYISFNFGNNPSRVSGTQYSEYFTVDGLNFTPRQIIGYGTARGTGNDVTSILAYGEYLTAQVSTAYAYNVLKFDDVQFSYGKVVFRLSFYKMQGDSGAGFGAISLVVA